jgi:hypothetical protein
MATLLDPKQMVSFGELLMSQVVHQEALIQLLIKKGIFSKKEFLETVKGGKLGDEERQKGISMRPLFLLAILWTLPWKGVALWIDVCHRKERAWVLRKKTLTLVRTSRSLEGQVS